jgi:ABC-type Fe3+-hydroxamate transport system substrate-binding protein
MVVDNRRTGGLRDDLGYAVPVPARVTRVVSLVPSLTETVALTAPGLLVGATDWCSHPAELDVVRVRGTKSPDVDAVIELAPDLVLANEEENRPQDLSALRAAGVAVWVTAPRTVDEALGSLARMLDACRLPQPSWLRDATEAWSRPYDGPRRRAFVPIWRRPWMCLGRDTFAGDVLARIGVDNVFADSGERYPKVTLAAARDRAPDLVVLPDEPYAFTDEEAMEAFGDWSSRFVHISGRHLTWYGPSLGEAREVLTSALAADA